MSNFEHLFFVKFKSHFLSNFMLILDLKWASSDGRSKLYLYLKIEFKKSGEYFKLNASGKVTIVKQGRSVLITIPSRWQIKEDPQRSSILGREINPDSALAVIKTIYEVSFSTSRTTNDITHENCGKFKMSISVSDFKQRHPHLASKNKTK